ncbi:hypothetical protein EVJ58_g1601 [Rhodofomes roseus]|uniref:Uncharacterized protein n=1 Tax=Rhodofomes roseus TaxID=34475 RepID=A0A4Y9YYK4_9APHY|nr:hypothetical protein EVJ58_g1601 [Rhodofomes roseus]
MDVPTMGEGKGLTWIVQSRPEIQLGKRQHVVLKTNAQRSGVGRLTSVADLRRHWVIFTVSGAPHSCNLRVPIPWAALDDLEGFTHSKFYFTLPALPRPHAEFSSPIFTSDEENPYEFELGERAESRSERLIARITNADADRRTSRSKMAEGPDGGKGGSESDSSGHTSMRIIPGSLAG